MKKVLVFDIDDTLILHTNERINHYNHPNRNTYLKDLIEELKYDKVYIYTNGTYGHGRAVVDNLYLSVNGIFARDNIPFMKPLIQSFDYVGRRISEDVQEESEYYFFDDQLDNLKTAKEKGWKTIWISPNFTTNYSFVDYSFPNIYHAIIFFIIQNELIKRE